MCLLLSARSNSISCLVSYRIGGARTCLSSARVRLVCIAQSRLWRNRMMRVCLLWTSNVSRCDGCQPESTVTVLPAGVSSESTVTLLSPRCVTRVHRHGAARGVSSESTVKVLCPRCASPSPPSRCCPRCVVRVHRHLELDVAQYARVGVRQHLTTHATAK